MDNTVGSLTQLQRSVIIGSILGDGYIRIMSGRKNAFLEVNHSYNAKDYVDWKYSILKNISGSVPKVRKGRGKRIAYRFYTKQHPEITELYRKFYLNKKKRIPADLLLNPVIIAVWYMDDGSKCRNEDVYLNTQQFNLEDQNKLMYMLNKIGIKCRPNKDKQYWRLRILKSSLRKFHELIHAHIIPAMNYKLSYNPIET